MRIGVLGFQGAVIEHRQHIAATGHEPVVVRYPEQLATLDGIILPVWGTCAGMILLAKELVNDSTRHLAVMDIAVKRNAYGTQIDSFDTDAFIPEVSPEAVPLVFIRAPYITSVGEGVRVLCRVDGHIVAAREGNMLATSFHPELTGNSAFHLYFAEMCRR